MNMQIMETTFLGNRVMDYLIALLVLFVGFLVMKIVVRVAIKYLKAWAQKSVTTLDDFIVSILEKIFLPVAYLSCFYLSIKTLTLSEFVGKAVNAIEMIILTFFVTRLLAMIISYGINMYLERRQEDPTLVRSLEGVLKVSRFLLWALAVIVLLDNLGYKVSTLLAGLGIGGVAVAIAAQTLLKDFFSYFSIVFDRPFKIGDFIIIGDFMGTVEYIGIKTTRIRSLGGEQVVFSNTDLTDSRVRNYKLMEQRRVLFRLGVTHQTSLDQLKEIPKIIEDIVRNTQGTRFDRAHFFSYGDFSLIIEVVYFVLNPDYNKYMDIQQEINFAIKAEFEKRGIEFAYPTQTVYVNKTA